MCFKCLVIYFLFKWRTITVYYSWVLIIHQFGFDLYFFLEIVHSEE